ncbi:MAG: hypothetical protein H6719_07510 [Sandaracinaceae bacterium]|nr:hypothetical protein [Sandaracinaceae bacterium]
MPKPLAVLRLTLAAVAVATTSSSIAACDLFVMESPEPTGVMISPTEITAWPDQEIAFDVTLARPYASSCDVVSEAGELISTSPGCRQVLHRASPFEGTYVVRVIDPESGASAEARVTVAGPPYALHDPVRWRRGGHATPATDLVWQARGLYTTSNAGPLRVYDPTGRDQVDSANPFVGWGRLSVDDTGRYAMTDANALTEGLHDLHIYDLEERRLLRSLQGAGMAEWIPGTDEIVRVRDGGKIDRWAPLREEGPTWSFDLPGAYAVEMAVSPDGSRLLANLAQSPDLSAREWHVFDLATGDELYRAGQGTEPSEAGAWSPDGARFAGAGGTRVQVFDAADGRVVVDERLYEGADYQEVAWSPDGRFIALGDHPQNGTRRVSGGRVALWDVEANAVRWITQVFENFTWNVAFSPDGSEVAATGDAAAVRFLDVETGVVVDTSRGPSEWVRSVRWSPSGSHLLVGQSRGADENIDRELFVYDADGEETYRGFGRSPHWVEEGRVAFVHDRLSVTLVDAVTGAELETVELAHPPDTLPADVTRALWHPTEDIVVGSLTRVGGLYVWDRTTGEILDVVASNSGTRFERSSDGRFMIGGGPDGVAVMRGDTFELVRTHLYPTSERDVVFALSADARFLTTASYQEPVRLFRLEDGAMVWEQRPDTAGGACAAVSPDGSRVLFAGRGGFEAWDTQTGAMIGSSLNNGVRNPECGAMDWHPDGTRVAIGGQNEVYVIDAEPAPPWTWWSG